MSTIPEHTRKLVRQRAGHRCEYCQSHQDLVMGRLQIDHIIPIAKDGSDSEENLCLACELCNQYKWMKTAGRDPITGKSIPLYNPRMQKWSKHFVWSKDGAEIIGITPCGRVTVNALSLNNDLAVTVRRNWIRAGWHPPAID